ncbi:hypothetical protein BJX63DRAFT_436950 [Aspergillus granulosus]|uniref:Uncharacterized protein n=1 Tax=Aspergillus granulosus TaxID=176169 RepID=A0ABR4GWF5_9EURO
MRAINFSLSLLSLIASTSMATKTTPVPKRKIGFEMEETSRGVIIPMDDWFGIDE